MKADNLYILDNPISSQHEKKHTHDHDDFPIYQQLQFHKLTQFQPSVTFYKETGHLIFRNIDLLLYEMY